jgi:hypothetical protein
MCRDGILQAVFFSQNIFRNYTDEFLFAALNVLYQFFSYRLTSHQSKLKTRYSLLYFVSSQSEKLFQQFRIMTYAKLTVRVSILFSRKNYGAPQRKE